MWKHEHYGLTTGMHGRRTDRRSDFVNRLVAQAEQNHYYAIRSYVPQQASDEFDPRIIIFSISLEEGLAKYDTANIVKTISRLVTPESIGFTEGENRDINSPKDLFVIEKGRILDFDQDPFISYIVRRWGMKVRMRDYMEGIKRDKKIVAAMKEFHNQGIDIGSLPEIKHSGDERLEYYVEGLVQAENDIPKEGRVFATVLYHWVHRPEDKGWVKYHSIQL